MNWIKENKKLIISWCIILLVAPFMMEVLLFVDIMGVEATIGFLLLLFNEYKADYELRKYKIRQFVTCLSDIVKRHPAFQLNVYCIHTISSVLVLVVTGSMTYAIVAWYPIMVLGDRFSGNV